MKKIAISALAALIVLKSQIVQACDACQKQQPKILKDVAHGAGPEGNFDYVIVGFIALITLLTLAYSLKYLFWPGEKQKNHIKLLDLSPIENGSTK